MELDTLLADLGLSEKESEVYLALLQLGSSTVTPISAKAGVKRTSIYNFIDRLVSLGLVTKTAIRGRDHYSAVHPDRLLEIQNERLERLQRAMPEFLGLYNLIGRKPRMSYFEGPDEVQTIVREEIRCKREARYIWTGSSMMDMIGGAEHMTEIDKARMENNVWIRVVRFKHKDILFPTSAHGEKFKRELRFAPPSVELTMGMGIYDTGKVGFFSSRQENFGILIESKELMELMDTFFTLLWERSIPAREGEG